MPESETDRIARQFIDRTLAKVEWTHEAHLRVGLWHLLRYTPEESLERLRQGIRTYNETIGVTNSETSGYHETLTRFYVGLLTWFLDGHDRSMSDDRLARVLIHELGDRDLPLTYYSRELLESAEARAGWVEPDLRLLPG